jgi:hypothetical protein
MLFEAVLFEDNRTGITPLSYFVQNAPLTKDEKRLYEAWRMHTRYGFFTVEKVTPGKELHLTALAHQNRYQVYEHRGTASIKEGSILIGRIVPFLNAWMFTTGFGLTPPEGTLNLHHKAVGLPVPVLP